jgi:hypothetical protein
VQDDVAVFWTEYAADTTSNPFGYIYGIRMDHCDKITEPKLIWNGSANSVNYDQADHADASYIPNRGLIPYVLADEYAWLIIVDETTLARTGTTTLAPIQIDVSANPLQTVEEVLVEGYDNFFNVFYTARTGSNDGWKINYTYNGVGGTRGEWYDSAQVAFDHGLPVAKPEGIISTMLREDHSKYIGIFYLNETGDAAHDLRATITTQSGGVVVDLSAALSATGTNYPMAVCPYKYDNPGSQQGFILVYKQGGGDVYVRYMNRFASGLSTPLQLVSGVGGSYRSFDIIETYDHKYMIVASKYNPAGFTSTDYSYWVIDRDLNFVTGSIFGGDTIQGSVTDVRNQNSLQIVRNDDGYSYFIGGREQDSDARIFPLPVITPDPAKRRCVTFELCYSSSSSSTSSSSTSSSSSSSSSVSSSSSSVSSSSTSAAIQDLTTYTEVDPGAYLFQVAARNTFIAMPINAVNEYLYKDFGPGYFVNFQIDFDFDITVWPGSTSWMLALGQLSNTLGTWFDIQLATDGLTYGLQYSSGQLRIVNMVDGANTNAATGLFGGTTGGVVYGRMIRVGLLFTTELYSNVGRTVLLATASLPCTATTYRYFYPCANRGVGSAINVTGYSENYLV